MALSSTGAIAFSDIRTEFLGSSNTNTLAFSQLYRGGGIVPNASANTNIPISGPIVLSNFYGATNRIALTLTIDANTNNYDVYTNAVASPSYVAGIMDVTVINNANIGSASVPAYALLVPASFNPGDNVSIVNNSFIAGRGGDGGPAGTGAGSPGPAGGNAIYVNRPVTITNNGTIGSGGGGGGGGGGGRSFVGKSLVGTNGGGGGAGGGGGTGGSPNGSPGPGAGGAKIGRAHV